MNRKISDYIRIFSDYRNISENICWSMITQYIRMAGSLARSTLMPQKMFHLNKEPSSFLRKKSPNKESRPSRQEEREREREREDETDASTSFSLSRRFRLLEALPTPYRVLRGCKTIRANQLADAKKAASQTGNGLFLPSTDSQGSVIGCGCFISKV